MSKSITQSPRPDMNWVLVDDVESLAGYVETFKLGRLVPLSEKLTQFTAEEQDSRGLMSLSRQRQEEVMCMPRENTEQTTYYTVLDPKQWKEMLHELAAPPTRPSLSSREHLHRDTWFEVYCRRELLPSALTFLMTNSAIIGVDTFWPMRLGADGKWQTLITENVPPAHQFKRRKT